MKFIEMKNILTGLVLVFVIIANPVAAQKKKVKNIFYAQNTLQGFTNTPKTAREKAELLKAIGYDGLEGFGYEDFYELKDALHFIKVLLDDGYKGSIGLQCYNLKGDVVMTLTESLKIWNNYKNQYLEEIE
mgnify:CR=1 FL=1